MGKTAMDDPTHEMSRLQHPRVIPGSSREQFVPRVWLLHVCHNEQAGVKSTAIASGPDMDRLHVAIAASPSPPLPCAQPRPSRPARRRLASLKKGACEWARLAHAGTLLHPNSPESLNASPRKHGTPQGSSTHTASLRATRRRQARDRALLDMKQAPED